MKKFNFHSDAGHGWVAVKLSLLVELGIDQIISPYSYMSGYSQMNRRTVYLEEDCDMGKFFVAYKSRFGIYPELNYLPQKNRSHIRSYPAYEV